MVEFEELRHLWQSQAQPETALALDGRTMTEVLRKFHFRQTIINCVRAGLLLFAVIFVPVKSHMAFAPVLGVVLLTIGMTIYLVEDWRNQIGIARLDFSKPSADFVENSVQRLQDMRYPFRRTLWVFLTSAVAGMNLISWTPADHATLFRTVIMHANATAFPFFAYWLGVRIRAKRFDMECRPIMEKLAAMKHAMQEHSA